MTHDHHHPHHDEKHAPHAPVNEAHGVRPESALLERALRELLIEKGVFTAAELQRQIEITELGFSGKTQSKILIFLLRSKPKHFSTRLNWDFRVDV